MAACAKQLLEVVPEGALHFDATKLPRRPVGLRWQQFGGGGEASVALGDQRLLPAQPLDLPGAEAHQHDQCGQRGEARPQARPELQPADVSTHA